MLATTQDSALATTQDSALVLTTTQDIGLVLKDRLRLFSDTPAEKKSLGQRSYPVALLVPAPCFDLFFPCGKLHPG